MSKKFWYSLVAVLIVTTTILAACGGGAAPEEPQEPAGTELAVGVVLPTREEPRWIQDETRFNDAFAAAGYDVEILFSEGDSAKERQNVEDLITKGVKVIIICPQDATAAAAAAEAARAAGVKVISYDRLIRETEAVDYYVTFDSIAVGEAQGQYLVDHAEGSDNPLYLYAGAASDNNAFLFFEGAWNVLQPKIADGTFYVVNSSEAVGLQDKAELTREEMAQIIGQVTTEWDFDTAKTLAESNLTAAGAEDKGDVFILAPNDGTARAIADAFAADADVSSYYVTGQDAEIASVQYIIDGKQSMTVLKDVRTLVSDAISAAVAYLEGSTPPETNSYNNGAIDVPAAPSEVVTVDQGNVQEAIIDSGYWPASEFTGLGEAAMPEEPAMEPTQVEVFSWWTGGGEAAGLEAMIEIFSAEYPNVEFINAAVAGGAGTNARAVLATRLQSNDPPDSWQGHAGQELIGTYVAGGQIEPLNDLYAAEGWLDVMPETLIPLISDGGNIYSVPVNIHRANVLWYNPGILDANGVAVPTTMDEWFAAMDTLQAAGVTPLALGEQWTQMHLMETVLLGSLGADAYNGLWDGSTDWGSAEVTAALDNFTKALSYTNTDAASLSWQDAAQLVVNGDAAFNVMGDWAAGYFIELEKEPMVDYGWAPTPGSVGVFQFLSDSFTLAVGAPHPDGAEAWLKIAGSKAGQEAFNPVKGSICARTDCDPDLFGVYLQSAMEDWSSNVVVGSLTHGVVANDSWKSEIDTALGLFVADQNVETFQAALVAACASSGPCQ
jgi:ABC-type xylose transport system substrate-binding protein/ABC-type glycerol-3-phosphate transport system substrate-binding protein